MKKAVAKYYFCLFAVCLVGFIGVFSYHIINGKTFVWSNDGIPLYLNFLIYEGELIRGLVSGIASGNYEGIPLYTFGLGYGSDALTPLAGSINDPLNLLSALCPPKYAEYLYAGLIFVRVFLSAVTFSYYAFSKGNGRCASFCGALCYAFSGYAIAWAMLRHPSFLTVMLLFPLVVAGADRVLKGKSPVFLIVSAGLSFFASLYFSYMVILLLVVYCAVAYFFSPREKSVRDFARVVLVFVGCLLVSFLLAAVMAVPVMLVLLSLGRVGTETWVPLLQSSKYYLGLLSSLLGGTVQTRGLIIGPVSTMCVIVFVLCGKRFDDKERKPLLIYLGICATFILIPYFGHALNGFSYVSDRWMFGFCFCVSYIVCKVVPGLREMKGKDWLAVGVLSGFICIAVVFLDSGGDFSWRTVMAVMFALVVLMAWLVSSRARLRVLAAAMTSFTIVGSSLVSFLYCAPSVGNAISGFGDRGTPWEKISVINPYENAFDIVDGSYRVSAPGMYVFRNSSLLSGTKGIDFFSSFYIQAVDAFRQELGLSDHYSNYVYAGSDFRYALDTISGAKYFVIKEGAEWRVPYSYEYVTDLGNGYHLYETKDSLPIAFVYDKWVSEETYQELNMVQKQEALLQGCVVAHSSAEEVRSVESASRLLDSHILRSEGLTIDNGVIRVNSSDAYLVLGIEECCESELYVCFEGLCCRSSSALSYDDSLVEEIASNLFLRESSSFDIAVSTPDGRYRSILSVNDKNVAYGGKQDWVINLGYFEEGCSEVTLEFPDEGVYTFDQISVVSQPIAPLVENVKRLNAGSSVSYSFGVNEISVSVNVDEAGLVYFSIPYSTGWSARVNGDLVEITEANTAFMAIELDDPGSYEISLQYETPGLRIGAALSALGVVILASIIVLPKLRNKKQFALQEETTSEK